jgi:glutaredoxin-like protein
MQTSKIRIYGANWCGDCRRAKLFMNDYGIEYEWIDTDQSKDAEDIVRTLNHGKRIIPTIIFPDGSILVEPSNIQLATKLGIKLADY